MKRAAIVERIRAGTGEEPRTNPTAKEKQMGKKMSPWMDPEIKNDAKELAASFVRINKWENEIPAHAELTVDQIRVSWNQWMKLNTIGGMLGAIEPEAFNVAADFGELLGNFIHAIHPSCHDRKILNLEICFMGMLNHLHVNHGFIVTK